MSDGTPAFLCGICSGPAAWRLLRHGDAVVSWACDDHLAAELAALQRRGELTQFTVQRNTFDLIQAVEEALEGRP